MQWEVTVCGVSGLSQDYGLSREDLDFVFSVTHFKSQAAWAADPFKARPSPLHLPFISTWLPFVDLVALE
jgi:hypothetical protein